MQFTLGPRESKAFNDIVVSQFNAPNTAGGIEFDYTGDSDQLVVTSRLYSTKPEPTVGMFIPALKNSEAHPTTVLTSVRNGGSNAGFRTNVGVFNGEDAAVDVTFTIFDSGHNQVGNPVTRSVGGHSGAQVNAIFAAAGAGGVATENAVVVVSASHEVFSYAAVIDNATTDPIFVVGAEDLPQQAITPSGPTSTPTQAASTPTPTRTPAPPTPTVTPGPPATRNVSVGPGGSLSFRDEVSGTARRRYVVGQSGQLELGRWTRSQRDVDVGGNPQFRRDKSTGTRSRGPSTRPAPSTTSARSTATIMSGTVVVNP